MKTESLLELDVSGVILEKQNIAKKELYDCFSSVTDQLGVNIKVLVTRDFDQTINDILRKKSGLEHHYTSIHESSVAVGKTFSYTKDGSIGFTVVFNGNVLGRWEDSNILWRSQAFVHESIHIVDETRFFQEIGEDCFSYPTTTEATLFRLSHLIWEEYNAERYSTEAIEKAVKGISPQGTITYALHDGFVESFVKLIETLPVFLTKNINDFRTWSIDINKLWLKTYPRLRETLVLAAYITAHSDALGKANNLEIIEKKHSFFSERWNVICTHLRSSYRMKNKWDREILTDIANELTLFIKDCGFSLSDVENGIYIAVSTPNFY
jgi:hypothetical protein